MSVRTVSLAEAKKSLEELVSQAAHSNQRIVLLSRGKPKAALVSLTDLEWLERAGAAGLAVLWWRVRRRQS